MRSFRLRDLAPSTADDVPPVVWADDARNAPTPIYNQWGTQVAGEAVHRIVTAARDEPAMTESMRQAASVAGGLLAGLEARMKSPESLARKIVDKAQAGRATPGQASERVRDVVRYTMTCTQDSDVISTARQAVDTLTGDGWQVVEAEHSYVDGNPYKGLNVTMQHESGEPAELQFLSETAYTVKDANHGDYETFRDPRADPDEQAAAWERSVERYRHVPAPDGVADLDHLGGVEVRTKTYSRRLG